MQRQLQRCANPDDTAADNHNIGRVRQSLIIGARRDSQRAARGFGCQASGQRHGGSTREHLPTRQARLSWL
jgi:hypothetical protein